jgi:hypothetical protein
MLKKSFNKKPEVTGNARAHKPTDYFKPQRETDRPKLNKTVKNKRQADRKSL